MTINLDHKQFIEIQDKQKYRGLPEIAYEAVWLLDLFLAKNMKVFEWGSGGSTIFFCQRAGKVVSIEHERAWYELVHSSIAYHSIQNCQYLFIEPSNLILPGYESSQYRDSSFRAYAAAIDAYPDGYFDVILVDGRARVACIQHAFPKLKGGGLLFLDNSNRVRYALGVEQLNNQGWQRLDFVSRVPYKPMDTYVQTSVWFKEEQ